MYGGLTEISLFKGLCMVEDRLLKMCLASLLGVATALSQFQLENAFPGIAFSQPVDFQHAGDGSNRIFVVEQGGTIRVFPNADTVTSARVFLNLTGKLISGGEQGLLGLAFHPQYVANGFLFLDYTAPNPLRTVVARYSVSASNPDSVDPASEMVLLEVGQPYPNHNGGQIVFGPDGYLYVALGDGGSGGDPQGNGQNLRVLLGKILRIDVDSPANPLKYGIPPDNPLAGNTQGYREEIFAYGLRNPWRFSLDSATGRLWAGDVGQNTREEIDIIVKGGNYGWNIMEGTFCYNPTSGCDTTGLTFPVLDYGRSLGYSVTGGYVYRGSRVPELTGKYISGDYGSGRIWSLAIDGVPSPVNTQIVLAGFFISSFGVDQNNELFICNYGAGTIHRFKATATAVSPPAPSLPGRSHLAANYPNPFNNSTQIRYTLVTAGHVEIAVYSVLGMKVATIVDDEKGAGIHATRWDGTDQRGMPVSSGVYCYRLTVDGMAVDSRMLMMVK